MTMLQVEIRNNSKRHNELIPLDITNSKGLTRSVVRLNFKRRQLLAKSRCRLMLLKSW